MRKREMNQDQLRQRSLFVDKLASTGWQETNTNRNFDDGLWESPEASMTYSSRDISLQLELAFDDPRMILYISSKSGKSLGLVFKCHDRQTALLGAIIGIQDKIAPDNIKEKAEELLTACPNMFKISASGDKLIPIKPKREPDEKK